MKRYSDEEILSAENFWNDQWERLRPVESAGATWQTPWLDASFHDGNPVFSSWSADLRRGIRVLHERDSSAKAHWFDRFGERGSPDEVAELVVAYDARSADAQLVARLIERWIADGSVTVSEPSDQHESAWFGGHRRAA